MNSRILLRSTLVVAIVIASACGPDRRGNRDLQVKLSFEPDPPVIGQADVVLEVADVDWRPRNGDRVIVTALREDVAVAVDTAMGQGAGQYRVARFPFPVAGDWMMTVRVETPGGVWAELDYPIEVVAPAPEG